MKSHLPDYVLNLLQRLASHVDEGLQAESHKVATAIAVDAAFNERYVQSPLQRSMIVKIAGSLDLPGLELIPLGNGGQECRIVCDGVERLFRFKQAKRDRYLRLDVRVSSDSILKQRAGKAPDLFNQEAAEANCTTTEQWVLPYLLHPSIGTLLEMSAAFPVGVHNTSSPWRLVLDRITPIPLQVPAPPSFPASQDDLDLGDDERDERDERDESGGSTAG